MKDGFIFYSSFYDCIKTMSDEDAIAFIRAICAYEFDNIPPEKTIGYAPFISFNLVRPQLDANTKRRENGKKGGRPANRTEKQQKKTSGYENKNHRLSNSKPKEKVKGKVKDNNPPTPLLGVLPDWLPDDVWISYCNFRREIKKPMTESMAESAIKQLDKFRKAGSQPADVIEKSIANGWQGLFQLDEKERVKKPVNHLG